MIDFGLVSLFAVEVALVALVYHAWRGVKQEVTALLRAQMELKDFGLRLDGFKSSIEQMDGLPKALVMRVKELETGLGKFDSEIDKWQTKWDGINGRVSALQREEKRLAKRAAEETDPASQDDDGEAEGLASLGSIPQHEEPQSRGHVLPAGFGKLKRRVG